MPIKTRPNSLLRLLILPFVFYALSLHSQDFPHEITEYPFIKINQNKLSFPGDSIPFNTLFEKFNQVIFDGQGQVNILHMGGSHIQAGVFSSQMRSHFQTIQPGLNSFRGFLFPFTVARTNNPSNFQVSYSGSWDHCRNVEKKNNCLLGLSGMKVSTNDQNASISIKFNDDYPGSDFNELIIYQDLTKDSYEAVLNDTLYEVSADSVNGYKIYTFKNPQDSLILKLRKTKEGQDHFTLYGLRFGNELPGFAYHAVGVNGASVPSYLRCDLLDEHTNSLDLDLVVFSIGINDAYGTRFSPEQFKRNYRELISRIQQVAPDVKIIFTTNNDSYYRRRYVNRNGRLVQKAMFELAGEYDAAVWDLFEIMGGLGSVTKWESYGLAKSDKIHFTKPGYELVGDMFFSALIKSYENYLMSKSAN